MRERLVQILVLARLGRTQRERRVDASARRVDVRGRPHLLGVGDGGVETAGRVQHGVEVCGQRVRVLDVARALVRGGRRHDDARGEGAELLDAGQHVSLLVGRQDVLVHRTASVGAVKVVPASYNTIRQRLHGNNTYTSEAPKS